MDTINYLKFKILSEKLNVYKLNIEKNEAVRDKQYEKAGQFRDQESKCYERLQELKLEVLNQLSALEFHEENIELYLDLQEILFEFHAIEFRNDNLKHSNLKEVQFSVAKYWQIRNDAYDNYRKFIESEYINLRNKWIEQVRSKDKSVRSTLKQLNHIRAFLMRFK